MRKSIILSLLLATCAPPTALVVADHSCTYQEEPALLRPRENGTKLGAIQFGRDSDRLDASARTELALVASELREQPDATVRIEGNCDPSGAREYNFALGLRRARAAKRFLIAAGVAQCQLEVVSFGAERAKERRVEVVLVRR